MILESACPCFRERLADPACILSPFHPAWRAALSAAGLLGNAPITDGDAARSAEWMEVEGVGSVFRRRGGPALLVSPMPLSPRMRQVMPALWAFDARPWLREIRLPTLVLCGTADPVVPVPHARALHEGIAESDFLALEGAGHVPVGEGRADVADAVQRFLRERLTRG
jgi:pimeloyl-ACP methyl ester carboxylesterase